MKRFRTKKVAVVVIASALGLGIAGGALAYFTSTGHGTGSVTVGTSTALTVASTAPTGGPLYPDAAIGGANVETVTYAVTNPSAGSQNLSQVVISVANSDGSAWSSQTNALLPACTASDFSVDAKAVGSSDTDTSLAGDIAAGATTASANVTVELIDNSANQDNCEGLTVPLYFSAS